MSTPRNKHLLLKWVFLAGLLLLAVNDHYLKQNYPGWLTGKLSDFAGLLIFPLFLAFVFPRAARTMPLFTGLFFIYWKSPWSNGFILLYNKFAPIPISRTIDYTDLLALVVLPQSYHLIRTIDRKRAVRPAPPAPPTGTMPSRWRTALLILPCTLIFMATSPPKWYKTQQLPKGDIYIGRRYKTRLTPDQVLESLRKEGYAPRLDTSYRVRYTPDSAYYYIIEHIPVPNMSDTLKSIQFQLTGDSAGSRITLNNLNLEKPINLGDWRLLKHFSKWYRRGVEKYLLEELK